MTLAHTLRISFFTLLLVMFHQSAFSQSKWDESYNFEGRINPSLSSTANAEYGYNAVLYGEPESSILYGLIRPNVKFTTIGIYNGAQAEIEVFPISFFGFKAGSSAYSNASEYSVPDCETLRCIGGFYYNYTSAHIALGAYGFFVRADYTIDKLSQEEANENFYEPSSTLIAQAAGDNLTTQVLATGWKDDTYTFILTNVAWSMEKTNMESGMTAFLVRYSWDKYSVLMGAGSIRSDLPEVEGGTTVLFNFAYTPEESYSLF
jgi:hypothetical protein